MFSLTIAKANYRIKYLKSQCRIYIYKRHLVQQYLFVSNSTVKYFPNESFQNVKTIQQASEEACAKTLPP